MNISDFIQWERKVGAPIYQKDGRIIRPISRTLSMWWRPYGGSVRNWPVAIEVQENGTVREIPIPNVTLYAQIGIGLILIILSLLVWATNRRHTQT